MKSHSLAIFEDKIWVVRREQQRRKEEELSSLFSFLSQSFSESFKYECLVVPNPAILFNYTSSFRALPAKFYPGLSVSKSHDNRLIRSSLSLFLSLSPGLKSSTRKEKREGRILFVSPQPSRISHLTNWILCSSLYALYFLYI